MTTQDKALRAVERIQYAQKEVARLFQLEGASFKREFLVVRANIAKAFGVSLEDSGTRTELNNFIVKQIQILGEIKFEHDLDDKIRELFKVQGPAHFRVFDEARHMLFKQQSKHTQSTFVAKHTVSEVIRRRLIALEQGESDYRVVRLVPSKVSVSNQKQVVSFYVSFHQKRRQMAVLNNKRLFQPDWSLDTAKETPTLRLTFKNETQANYFLDELKTEYPEFVYQATVESDTPSRALPRLRAC